MSWSQSWSFKVVYAADLVAAMVVFNQFGLSVSSLAGLVRDGRDGPLRLYRWQRAFLAWLGPRLSRAHTQAAIASDLARAQEAVRILMP